MHIMHDIIFFAGHEVKGLMSLADKVEELERKVAKLEDVSEARSKQDEQFEASLSHPCMLRDERRSSLRFSTLEGTYWLYLTSQTYKAVQKLTKMMASDALFAS
jgi:hypothetical protein